MEHLFIALMHGIEEWVRPRLRDVLPDHDSLADDPVGYLAAHDGAHVGPRRYPVVAVLSAVPFGLLGGLAGYGIDAAGGLVGAVVAGAVLGAVLGPFIVYRLNHGGDLHLVPAGVVFSYGKKDVLCPWRVFCPKRDAARADQTWWKVPVYPAEIDGVALLVRGAVRQSGRDVRTTHFWVAKPNVFRRLFAKTPPGPPDTVSVRDCYAARPKELYALILDIAPRLARADADRTETDGPDAVTPGA